MKIIKNKTGKQAILSAVLFVVVILIYMELNVLISKISIGDIDITSDKRYTISEESRLLISKIDKDVEIELVDFDDYMQYVQARDASNLIKKYHQINNRISIANKKTDNTENQVQIYPKIIIRCGEKEESLSIDDLYMYKYSTEIGAYEEYGMIEEVLTNNIVKVAKDENSKIYLYTSKMVYPSGYLATFVNRAKNLGNEVLQLDMEKHADIYGKDNFIVIPPLKEDLTNEEKNFFIKYAENGGNILFLCESKSLIEGETPNYDELTEFYGLSMSEGVVIQNKNTKDNTFGLINPVINKDNGILKSEDLKLCMIDAGVINISDDEELKKMGVTVNYILGTDASMYLRKDLKNINTEISENDEKIEGAALGVQAIKKIGDVESKAIMYSNSLFITDSPMYIKDIVTGKNVAVTICTVDDNDEIMTRTIEYLIENKCIINRSKRYDSVPSIGILNDGLTLKLIIIVPLIVLFIGYIVWRSRRKRK